MTNLSEKFDAFQELTTAHHNAIISALEALGGLLPPSPTGATLDDVITAINVGNGHLAVIRADTILLYAAFMDTVPEMRTSINAIATNMEILIENTSTNAQLATADAASIIARLTGLDTHNSYGLQQINTSILATACPCVDGPPVIGPPLSIIPISIGAEEKCKRVQAFLSVYGAVVDSICNLAGSGASIGIGTIGTILASAAGAGALVGGEVGAVAGPPGIVAGILIGVITGLLIGGAQAIFGQLRDQWHTEPLVAQLRDALYSVNTAEQGNAQFYDVIDNSTVITSTYKPFFKALWWSGWSNDLYNAEVTINTDGFDGTICDDDTAPPEGCGTWPSSAMTFSTSEMVQISTPFGNRWVPDWSKYSLPVLDDGRPDEFACVLAPCTEWTYVATGDTLQFYQSDPEPDLDAFSVLDDPSGTIAAKSSKLLFWSYGPPFTLTLTPP